MELTDVDIEVLEEVRELLEDEGFELYNVGVGGFNNSPGERNTEIDCTIIKTTTSEDDE